MRGNARPLVPARHAMPGLAVVRVGALLTSRSHVAITLIGVLSLLAFMPTTARAFNGVADYSDVVVSPSTATPRETVTVTATATATPCDPSPCVAFGGGTFIRDLTIDSALLAVFNPLHPGGTFCCPMAATDGAFGGAVEGLTGTVNWDLLQAGSNRICVIAIQDGAFGIAEEQCLTLTVTDDENQAPTDIALSATSVTENQPGGTTIGTFSTTDPDSGDTFRYTLVDNGAGELGDSLVTIIDNTLRTSAIFDYETTTLSCLPNCLSIRVRSTDSQGLYVEIDFVIDITNVNEAPTDIGLAPASIFENQASGTSVGSFTVTDADSGDTATYSLVEGTGATDNTAFTIAAGDLQTAAVFDYETQSSYSIRVRVTDTAGLSFEKQFTITVVDVTESDNRAPVAVNDTYGAYQGNAFEATTSVGVLANDTDPDAGTTLAAESVTEPGHGTLTLHADGSFLYTPDASFFGTDTFTYRASDGDLTSDLATVTINVASLASVIDAESGLSWFQKQRLAGRLDPRYTGGPAECGQVTALYFELLPQRGSIARSISDATRETLLTGATALRTDGAVCPAGSLGSRA